MLKLSKTSYPEKLFDYDPGIPVLPVYNFLIPLETIESRIKVTGFFNIGYCNLFKKDPYPFSALKLHL